jgi:hypothetical protein
MKFYTKSWIHGSIRLDCTAEERSIFADLMAMANESRSRGIIQANPTTPYPHQYIAQVLNVPLGLLERCLKKFQTQGRIHENETGIFLSNFEYYNPPQRKTGKRGRPPKYPPEQLPLEPLETFTGKPDPKAKAIWSKALLELQREVSRSNYSTWFGRTVGLQHRDGRFIIGVPSEFVGTSLQQSQTSLIERVLGGILSEGFTVVFQTYGKQ